MTAVDDRPALPTPFQGTGVGRSPEGTVDGCHDYSARISHEDRLCAPAVPQAGLRHSPDRRVRPRGGERGGRESLGRRPQSGRRQSQGRLRRAGRHHSGRTQHGRRPVRTPCDRRERHRTRTARNARTHRPAVSTRPAGQVAHQHRRDQRRPSAARFRNRLVARGVRGGGLGLHPARRPDERTARRPRRHLDHRPGPVQR